MPDGNYNVEFKIYNAASGGTLHWTETRTGGNTVTIKNGYLSVALGSVNAFSNASPAIDWSNGNYLTMNIGGIGTPSWNGEMSPRILITSVPYAFRAAEASQIKTVNGANVSSLSILAPTGGNQVFQIQDQGSAGTYNLCIQNSASCGYALLGGANTFTGVNTFSSAGTALQVTNNASIGGTLGVTGLTTATGGLTTGNNSLFTNGGATLNNTLAIGNKDYSGSGNTGTIGTAATTVDIYTNFTIAQTTAGQTLTIPSPTSTTTGRLIYITNIGSAGYTMAGAVVSPGVTMQFVWNSTTSSWSLVTSGVSGSYIQNDTALQTANFNIQSNAVGSVTATIQGANSQTANILEVKASGVSNPLLSISPTGATVFQNSSDSTTALQVKNSAGTNTVLDVNTTNGRVGIGTTSPSNTLEVSRARSVVSDTQLTVTNSTSGGYGAGVLFSGKRSDDGLIYSQAKITADGDQTWSSAATQSSSLRFFTVQGGTLSEKMRISAGGTLAVNSTTFGTNNKLIVNPYSTVDNLATAQINTNNSANKGLVVQGYAGQTASLQQWQDSSGSVLAQITSGGTMQYLYGGPGGSALQNVATDTYVQSRGQNLVTNGFGALNNNTNFSGLVFNSVERFSGFGSFTYNGADNSKSGDEKIAVDVSKRYIFSYYAKLLSKSVPSETPTHYGMVIPIASDGALLQSIHSFKQAGSKYTTLAAPLNPGDTTITLTDATGWANTGSSNKYIGFYPYTDTNGYTWPDYTYTKDVSAGNLWNNGGVSGNVITLAAPWSGASKPAGTKVANNIAAGTYDYIAGVNVTTPSDWGKFEGGIGPTNGIMYSPPAVGDTVVGNGGYSSLGGFRWGTSSVQIGWLLSYNTPTGTAQTALSAISFGIDTSYSNKLTVIQPAGSSANLQEWMNDTGVAINVVTSTGNLGIGTASPGAQLQVNSSTAGTIGQIIKGSVSQTSDLLQLQDSSANILAGFTSSGRLAVNTSTVGTTSALTVKGTSSVATVGVTNLLTADGTFATSTGWTPTTGWTIGSGVVTHATGNTGTLSGTSTATSTSVVYQVNFTVTQTTAGAGFGVSLGGADSGTTINTAGAKTLYIRPTSATGTLVFTPLGTGDWVGTIDDVTVYPVNVSTPEISVVGSNGASTPIEVRQSGSALGSFGIGAGSLKSNLGTSNTGVGTSTLMYNASGINNTAMGAYTLMNNTSGNYNVGFGVQSLYNNISGSYNSGVGAYSLYSNTTGTLNSAFGYMSLYNNISGNNNSAFGYSSLYNNSIGLNNSGVGAYSLYSNTTGNINTAVGLAALYTNTTGSENSAVGYTALYSSATSSGNVALGAYAGRYFATSSALTNPIYSTFLGYNTRASADGNTNEIVIGYNALGNGSNSVTLGSTAISKTILQGNVGIGNASPGARLQVDTGAAGTIGQVIKGAASQTADLLQVQDSSGNVNSSFNATGNQLTLGRVAASGTVTQGKLLFADGTTDNFAGTLQSATLTAARTWTLPDVGGTLCTTTTCALGTGGTAIVQVPASTANNTIAPTAAGVTGLTVNGTNNVTTAGTALVVTQANAVTAVDGVDINLTNTSGTLTNGLLINRNGAGGTTTNLLNLTNTAGTATNGIVFNGTVTTDITTAATRALKVVTGTTGGLTLDTGTTGQIDIGTNANAKTVNIGSATGTSITNIQGGSGTAAGDLNLYTAAGGIINIGVNSVTNKVVNIGSTGSVAQNSTINIANTNSNNAQLVRIGSTANTGSNVLIQGGAHASAISLQAAATGNILIGTVNSNNLSLNTGATTGTTTLGGTSTSGIITLGQSSGASNTINIGNVAGNTFTQTINMGNSATAGSVTNVTIGSLIGASSTNIQAGTGNLDLLTNSATASVIVQSQTNGTGAFSVKNSASTNVFNVNTTNSTVGINYNNTASTDAALSIVNTTTANDTLLLKNASSQTGYSLNIQNPASQSVFKVWSDGSLDITNQSVNSNSAIQVRDTSGFTNFNINNNTGFITINGLKDASGNILQDGGFEGGSSFTWAANEVTTGDGIYNDSANARNGNRELKIAGSSSGTDIVSQQWFAVTPGDAIYFEGYVKSISGNGDAGIYLEFRDKDKANPQYINSFTGTPGSSYGIKSINSTVPANMVYVRPVVTKRSNATAGTYYFDDMYLAGTTLRAPASFRNSVNSTSAFQIQSSGGSDTLFTADTTNNTIKVGNNTGTGSNTTLFVLDNASTSAGLASVAGAMYYDTTKGHVQCYEADGWGACGSAPDNIVNLNPEYSGAVLNGTGVGTMTTDLCANGGGLTVNTGLCASGEARNLYKWTSPQATQQTYSIYVSYQLPSTFKAFADDNTVQLTGRVDNTTNAAVTYQMFRSEGGSISACGTETTVTTSANVWQTVGINGNESTGCGFTSSSGGAFVIFKINVKANSGANAYVSTLGFTTTGK